ncbi:DUF2382 domain-containing protein [Nocardioides mesophilus]|uniref:PRC and DUF2382 domain-containing protein n=1 Tax=Nocardioides mesophilus TaxID=433659 RepID=A0A7G9R6R4_9ACTN|nr:PRC and DUF2382 domain-containing protein [Nocardioides mesophilus]QNN51289.1 PRC and DUF2382 domain-containing protein [Nocardioides mesophilus]
MLNTEEARNVIGRDAYAQDGDKLGKIGQLFLDDETGRPEFITVNTGLFGMNESFIPVADATIDGDRITVPFDKSTVKDAPNVDASDGHISQDDERRVYDHYNLGYSETRSDTGLATGETTGYAGTSDLGTTDTTGTADFESAGHDTSGPNTDEAMTRSEERVDVGTRDEESGRVRLRKYVETEHVTQTVPVRKERAVLEREPITDSNVGAATSGPAISDEEHEVILHEERPVVEKTTEAVERVRLGKETDVQEHEVSEDVRKEQIEVDGDVDDRR